jgi:hypothetical protein
MIAGGGDLRVGLIGAATALAFYGAGTGVKGMNLSTRNESPRFSWRLVG